MRSRSGCGNACACGGRAESYFIPKWSVAIVKNVRRLVRQVISWRVKVFCGAVVMVNSTAVAIGSGLRRLREAL